jgi:Flp pilus assembly protein TadG
MEKIIQATTELARSKSGAIAMIVAVAVPALVGAAALSVDMASYRYVENRMQNAADAAALAGLAKIDKPAEVPAEVTSYARNNVPSTFGSMTTTADVTVGVWDPITRVFTPGTNPDTNAVRVRAVRSAARGNAVPTILMQMFGTSPNLSAEAVAARQLVVQYEPPVSTNLSNEAHDFNELYAYCYNASGGGTVASRRTQMTLISNNYRSNRNVITDSGGFINAVPANPLVWPECAAGESLSFRLRNLRSAKNEWENGRRPATNTIVTYNHFTDTRISLGVEYFDGLNAVTILETVRCDTEAACTPGGRGSIIQTGRNRTPAVSTVACEPGKYKYFGWEDRPPELGGSDRDYDDIRILMKCPRQGRLGDGMSRLVG